MSTTRTALAWATYVACQPARASSRWASCSSLNQSRPSRWPREGQKPPTARSALVRKETLPPWKVRSSGSTAIGSVPRSTVASASSRSSESHSGRPPGKLARSGPPAHPSASSASPQAPISAASQPGSTTTSSSTSASTSASQAASARLRAIAAPSVPIRTTAGPSAPARSRPSRQAPRSASGRAITATAGTI